MPKRDQEYMNRQRNAITKAALTVLLEKGVHETSLRDICRAADVSMGALYTHFKDRNEIVYAACLMDHAGADQRPRITTWQEYLDQYCGDRFCAGTRAAKRVRISLQLVAELTQTDRNPAGLSEIYQLYVDALSSHLRSLHENDVITLPHGLSLTTEMHMQIITGADYRQVADREADVTSIRNAAFLSLALTAGLIDSRGCGTDPEMTALQAI